MVGLAGANDAHDCAADRLEPPPGRRGAPAGRACPAVANAVIWLESSDRKKSLTPDAATWTISIIPLRAPAAPKIAEDIQESARGTSLGGLMPRLLDLSFERELNQLVRASLRSIG
jgi:hypothetical protein